MIDLNQRKRITNNLYDFYFTHIAKRYTPARHAEYIYKISRYIEDMVSNRNKYTKDRLCISVPPQHSKSSLVTLAFPLWIIVHNPNARILIANAEQGLSQTFGVKLREMAKQILPIYGFTLSENKQSSTEFMFDKNGEMMEGSIRLTGVGGSITGHPVDYMIIDDPYKGLSDLTPTYLKKRIEWFQMIAEQRLRPESKLIILHTRWHTEDLIGFLQKNFPEDYTFLTFPAISSDDKPLWEGVRTLEWYREKRRKMGERLFSAIYQQQPLDLSSKFFHMEHAIWEEPGSFRNRQYENEVRAWDVAYDEDSPENENAYTVGVPMIKVSEKEYWVFDYVRGRFGELTKDKIKYTARMDGTRRSVMIETGTDGGSSEALFKMWKKEMPYHHVIQAKTHSKSKPDRAFPLAGAIYDGHIHFCISDPELKSYLEQEFNSFPFSKYKDLVDATAHAYNYLSSEPDLSVYGVVDSAL